MYFSCILKVVLTAVRVLIHILLRLGDSYYSLWEHHEGKLWDLNYQCSVIL